MNQYLGTGLFLLLPAAVGEHALAADRSPPMVVSEDADRVKMANGVVSATIKKADMPFAP